MVEMMEICKNEVPRSQSCHSPCCFHLLKLAHYTTRKIHHRMKLCSKKKEKVYCLGILHTGILFPFILNMYVLKPAWQLVGLRQVSALSLLKYDCDLV